MNPEDCCRESHTEVERNVHLVVVATIVRRPIFAPSVSQYFYLSVYTSWWNAPFDSSKCGSLMVPSSPCDAEVAIVDNQGESWPGNLVP